MVREAIKDRMIAASLVAAAMTTTNNRAGLSLNGAELPAFGSSIFLPSSEL